MLTDDTDALENDAAHPGRPALLVLVRHAESERNVAKKGNRFFLDDEAPKSVQGVADHRTPLSERGREQAFQTGIALRDTFGLLTTPTIQIIGVLAKPGRVARQLL